MSDFFPARGCVYVVGGNGSSKGGAYALEPAITLPQGTYILMNQVNTQLSDISDPAPCLGNVKVFWSFGQKFGTAQIGGEILLGSVTNPQPVISALGQYFNTNRASNLMKPINLSGTSGERYAFYLDKFNYSGGDPELNTLLFAFNGYVIDLGTNS